jgi:cysteine desulfurase/selenocysteine lyase
VPNHRRRASGGGSGCQQTIRAEPQSIHNIRNFGLVDSVPNAEDYGNFDQGWKQGALAWETGTGPTALIHGLEASLRLLTEVGIDHIATHLEQVTDQLCERLNPRKYQVVSSRLAGEKSQIVCRRHTGGLSPMALYSHLKKRNIITAPRGDRLGVSPHLYNTLEYIDETRERSSLV